MSIRALGAVGLLAVVAAALAGFISGENAGPTSEEAAAMRRAAFAGAARDHAAAALREGRRDGLAAGVERGRHQGRATGEPDGAADGSAAALDALAAQVQVPESEEPPGSTVSDEVSHGASSSLKFALGNLPPLACAAPGPPAGPGNCRGRWLDHVGITEYYPAPESWAVGAPVAAPGLSGRHRVDWLYGASNSLSMEGDGIDLQGRRVHIEESGPQGWVDEDGRVDPIRSWSLRPPYWRAVGWRNMTGAVTFSLLEGGWSQGPGVRFISPRGIRFAPGPSLPLRYWRSLATDPRVIPSGSTVFIPAYGRAPSQGWFLAQDTGSAIAGRRIDIYRPPPSSPGGARSLSNQRVYVVRPG